MNLSAIQIQDRMKQEMFRHYVGCLTYLDIQPVVGGQDINRVRMIVEIPDADPLELFRRLHSILDVCLEKSK